MRILHFSDFHLSSGEQMKRSLSVFKRMMECVSVIHKEDKIDLIIFTGDMLDGGTKSFPNISEGFIAFEQNIIKPMLEKLSMEPWQFIMVPGNHDMDFTKISQEDMLKLRRDTLKSHVDLEWFMHQNEIDAKIPTTIAYDDFRDKYYNSCVSDDVLFESTRFQSNLKFKIGGVKVGITMLHSSWLCHLTDEANRVFDSQEIAIGKSQITESEEFLSDCNFNIAASHHHYSFLKEFEHNVFERLLSKQYDIYFSGHTHEDHSRFIGTDGGICFQSIASGTLRNNIAEQAHHNKNSFIVYDVNPLDYSIVEYRYRQGEDEKFVADYTYGEGTGRKEHNLGDHHIFNPLDRWLPLQEDRFVGSPIGLDFLRAEYEKICNVNNGFVIIKALPGFGKTRLIYDTFKDEQGNHPYHYYGCLSGGNQQMLFAEINHLIGSSGDNELVVVIDNCTIDICRQIYSTYSSIGGIRLILVVNEYYDSLAIDGIKVIDLGPKYMENAVNEYIETNIHSTDADLVKDVQNIADGFPGMAVALVDVYNEKGSVNVQIADELVSRLLQFTQGEEDNQEHAIESISLFQPFPYDNGRDKAFCYILNNEILCQIDGSEMQKRRRFRDVIVRFENKLIENTGVWLNVRPFPLAVWLAGKWCKRLDDYMIDALLDNFDKLKGEDPIMHKTLQDSFCKRITYMKDNENAKVLVSNLLVGDDANFKHEKVVFSDMGSRLFLAFAHVNPVAVGKCLFSVIRWMPINIVEQNISGDIRRNLVWTLEKTAYPSESFKETVLVLAKFALAENETWGNNATSQLKQLFHVSLPGTTVDLNERYQALEYLSQEDECFRPLVVDLINNAFMASGFVRMGGSETFGIEKMQDYRQKYNNEVWDYWVKCSQLLIKLAKENESCAAKAFDVVVSNSYQWLAGGHFYRLLKPVSTELLALKNKGCWGELYDSVSRIRSSRMRVYSEDQQREIEEWKNNIKPNDIATQLRKTRFEYYDDAKERNGAEALDEMRKLTEPIAKLFVESKSYESMSEVANLLDDKEYLDFFFTRCVASIATKEQLRTLFVCIDNNLRVKEPDYHSSFLGSLCYETRSTEELNEFFDKLKEYNYKLFVHLSARCDDENLHYLNIIIDDVKNGLIDTFVLQEYLRYSYADTAVKSERIIDIVMSELPSEIICLVEFVCRSSFRWSEYPNLLKVKIKTLLLQYPISNEYPGINVEYARFVRQILDDKDDPDFASEVFEKFIKVSNGKEYLHGSFEGLMTSLLLNYFDAIADRFFEVLLSDDYPGFWLHIYHEIGSGFGFGKGPLFKVAENKVRDLCLANPKSAPMRIAELIPIYDEDDDHPGFSNWLIWLLDNFGDQQNVINGIDSNMNTFGWTGSVIGLYEHHINSLELLLNHKYPLVRQWATERISIYKSNIKYERDKDDYMRLQYGKSI